MKDPKKKVITPKTWNKIERQKDKILDQAEEIQRQKERIAKMFEELEGHPAITLKPNIDIQTILLRHKVDGRRQIVPYEEDKDTEQWLSLIHI